jgi:hypothetical protein
MSSIMALRTSVLRSSQRDKVLICIQFAHYLAQEMQSGAHLSNDGDTSDDDEDDSGWLAHSTFDLRPPVQARQHDGDRRPLSATGFGVRASLQSELLGAHGSSGLFRTWFVINWGGTICGPI